MELSEHQQALPRQAVAASVGIETFADYKAYLRHRIETAGRVKGYQTRLAQAAACHPSFISQVLNTPVHLTPDHGAGLAEFWGLGEGDTEYFLCLVQRARAASPVLAHLIDRRLNVLKTEKLDLAKRFRVPSLSGADREALYYSSWLYSAVHILATIPEFQKPSALSAHLGLPLKKVREILEALKAMALVSESRDRWVPTGNNLHLPRQSPRFGNHLLNWRNRALVAAAGEAEGVHYSAVHALSKDDAGRLKQLVMKFLDETRAVVAPSPEEQGVCLNVDYFPL